MNDLSQNEIDSLLNDFLEPQVDNPILKELEKISKIENDRLEKSKQNLRNINNDIQLIHEYYCMDCKNKLKLTRYFERLGKTTFHLFCETCKYYKTLPKIESERIKNEI